jgi:hypothetical protein
MKIFVVIVSLLLFAGCQGYKTPCTYKVKNGYTQKQVLEICGKPDRISRIRTKSGAMEQWVYYEYHSLTGYNKARFCCVYIEKGKVVGLRD